MGLYEDLIAGSLFYNALQGASAGPADWLPQATPFNGTSSRLLSDRTIADCGDRFTILVWHRAVPAISTTSIGGPVIGTNTSTFALELGHSSSSFRGAGYVRQAGGAWAPSVNAPIANDTTQWRQYGLAFDLVARTFATVINGVVLASTGFPAGLEATTPTITFGSGVGRFCRGDFAGALIVPTIDSADIAALYAGPLPLNTTAPVIDPSGLANAGTWDSQSNGTVTLTYEWEHEVAGQWELADHTGTTFPPAAVTGRKYRLIERASNDGGSDPAGGASSNVITSVPRSGTLTKPQLLSAATTAYLLPSQTDTLADARGNFDGSQVGVVTYLDGPDGRAADCSVGYIATPVSSALRPQDDDWSFSVGFRLTDSGPANLIASGNQFSSRPNFAVMVQSDRTLQVRMADGNTDTNGVRVILESDAGAVGPGWHQLTFAIDRTANRLTAWFDRAALSVNDGTASGDGVDVTGLDVDRATPLLLGADEDGSLAGGVQLHTVLVFDGVALSQAHADALFGAVVTRRRPHSLSGRTSALAPRTRALA